MSCDFFPVPTAAPENLIVVNISANELNVSWERPNEININGILRYYVIDYYILNQEENMTSANVSGEPSVSCHTHIMLCIDALCIV